MPGKRRTSRRPARNPDLASRSGRPRGTFYGDDEGTWRYTDGYPLSLRRSGWTWEASIGLAGPKTISVEGATEWHRGFRAALRQIVSEYSEVAGFRIQFDGPPVQIASLLSDDDEPAVWLHGTTDAALPSIIRSGLRPRDATGAGPVFGAEFGARPSNPARVYLTTQRGMARFAARSAARQLGGEPVVLRVVNLDPELMRPDEDSGEADATRSLGRLGSVSYEGAVRPEQIAIDESLADGEWTPYQHAVRENPDWDEEYARPPYYARDFKRAMVPTSQIASPFMNPISQKRVDELRSLEDAGFTLPPVILDGPGEVEDDEYLEERYPFLDGHFPEPGEDVWFVHDGHHRVTLAMQRGERFVDALIISAGQIIDAR
jgi:hypothetical protein